ncbi:DUF1592 domain-containing protein [Schlesneria paludicola]|uniref:DUF1592 domain-containing protein n=1 Tax=Schlesneria paludicola TaxID=360056 RepID=UPI0003098BF1|nr:DUF1592 domain-containing protein [Schlesneria paludicola]
MLVCPMSCRRGAKCIACIPARRHHSHFTWFAALILSLASFTGQLRADDDRYPAEVTPFAKKYCAQCHEGDDAQAGVSFAKYADEKSMLKDRRTWEKIFNVLKAGSMPPADEAQPTPDEKAKLIGYLDDKLHRIDCTTMSDPGRVTIRRLNRAEYNNTVRDLFGITFKPAEDFPSDDVGYGFDNIGDVLSLPPLLMEKYLSAAEKVAHEALLVIDPASAPVQEFPREQLHRSNVAHPLREDLIILVSYGDVFVEYDFPRSGQYILKVSAGEQPAGDEHSKMEFRLDDKPVQQFIVKDVDPKFEHYQFALHVDRGRHKFSIAFLNDFFNETAEDKNRRDRNLIVRDLQIVGPTAVDQNEYPAFQHAFLTSMPGEGKSVADAARDDLKPFLRRAFRRPVTDDEVNRFVGLAERVAATGESFVTAMQVAVTGVLVSPEFLFRVETDKNPNDASERHAINDHELATRLSYFLWSSLPDQELMTHADAGDLHTDAVIETQIRRMLKDPKSQALVDNFAEQWLQLRILNEITPDPKAFPEFNGELREDMKRETSHFFAHIMREDLSILDFLDASYTFVNDRLAKHYGIDGVSGAEFRQVPLAGKNRAGLLTQASVLTLTSNPDRTSPVKRGKWVMEVLLNQPPPPPPPNVPELKATAQAQPDLTLRQQLELHRSNASCASCHRVMDQLGFGIENFDAIGRWRDTDGNQALDTRGELPGGRTFQGPLELTHVLRGKQAEFADSLTEKMLTYALGRGLEYYDRCTTAKIVESLKGRDFKFSVLVTEIAKSEPFRMRRGEDAK